ncbi:MAG: hypothetical protein WC789_06995 [Lentisphaeria bacterium]
MARSTPTATKGTIPVSGGGNRDALFDLIQSSLTAFLSGGIQAWTEAQVISAVGGSQDYVYHSVGDRNLVAGEGDADIWLRLTQTAAGATITVKVYQDWSPTSGTGHRECGTSLLSAVNDTQALDWWIVVNEYEFAMVYVQGGVWRAFSVGQTIRPYSTRINGICRTTEAIAVGGGATQTIDVDRDLTANLQVNQKVWLVNQTPDGVALQSRDPQLVNVDAVTASTITFTGITGDIAIGSLVGLDPQPEYVTLEMVVSSSSYWVHTRGMSWTSATGQTGQTAWLGSQLTEAANDPDYSGYYPGFQGYQKMTGAAFQEYRGKMQHVRIFGNGTQADGDIMQIEADATNQWWVFPSVSLAGSGWCVAIGPGAYV